jgi:sulfur-carrier protein
MTVTVKFFASLQEQTGCDRVDITIEQSCSVKAIWKMSTSLTLDPHILVAINHAYRDQESDVCDGDEVAFFPPVTGG